MDYRLSLGAWGSVFAVPGELVDKHLRLAGGVQLKVILYLLRHSEESLSASDIAQALSLPAADVRDSMLYWEQTGLVCISDGNVTPPPAALTAENAAASAAQTETASAPQNAAAAATPGNAPQNTAAAAPVSAEPKKASRLPVRPDKPDIHYLSRRMEEDESIAYLMTAADSIFGRLMSNNDKATLLMMHEYDGLPVEVIIMLLQYASDIQKCNMSYIQKIAISWADEEINTIDRAEAKIKKLIDKRSASGRVQRLFGLEAHSPTKTESELADRWINEWGFSDDMLRLAYEKCVDIKQKYIPNYVNRILTSWHEKGLKTPDEVYKESASERTAKKTRSYGAAYDISEYESTSVYDEE